MSAPKHTAGPWILKPARTMAHIHSESGRGYFGISIPYTPDNQSNAARIVACVNACEGLAHPALVPDLVAALDELAMAVASLRPEHKHLRAQVACDTAFKLLHRARTEKVNA